MSREVVDAWDLCFWRRYRRDTRRDEEMTNVPSTVYLRDQVCEEASYRRAIVHYETDRKTLYGSVRTGPYKTEAVVYLDNNTDSFLAMFL